MKVFSLNKVDLLIITLNFAAFITQILMPEGKTSIAAFGIFAFIMLVIITETYLAYGWLKSHIFSISKVAFYIIAIGVLLYKGGNEFVFTKINLLMVVLSICGLGIRKYLKDHSKDQKATILLWVQNAAFIPGSIAYMVSVAHHPDDYGIYSLIFWGLNIATYIVTMSMMVHKKEPRPAYIFPGFAMSCCIIYCIEILLV